MDVKEEETNPLLLNHNHSYDSMEKSSESEVLGSGSVEKACWIPQPQPVHRRPFHYPSMSNLGNINEDQSIEVSATVSRHRYYSKLTDPSLDTLKIPDHVVPSYFFYPFPFRKLVGKQSSIITIFSIWNTMMGTSLLSMPWAVQQAGFAFALVIILVMCGICLYTALRIIRMPELVGNATDELLEFSDVARHFLGRWAEWFSLFFSLLTLLGSAVVYWVLMTNFSYHTVLYLHELVTGAYGVPGNTNSSDSDCSLAFMDLYDSLIDSVLDYSSYGLLESSRNFIYLWTLNFTCLRFIRFFTLFSLFMIHLFQFLFDFASEVICTSFTESTDNSTLCSSNSNDDLFHKIWDVDLTVPFFLLVMIFPVINLKSPTFFTKFNALGTLAVMYLIVFTSVKSAEWGMNFDVYNSASPSFVQLYMPSFPALSGVLSLAFFIHNCILSLCRNQKKPENNVRDITIAFMLVCMTYLFIGVLLYITFPLKKVCIADNILNNFGSSDLMAFLTRLFLLFQVFTLFPLILYLLRIQAMHFLFGCIYPGLKQIVILNSVLLVICILFAIYFPRIGTIIRFSGSFSGLAYVFALPCITYLKAQKDERSLTLTSVVFHVFLVLLGFANFVAQFFVDV
ncbi:sodium-coupled neutral amino acid transporter 9-like isoform X3 [Limulus polyphemus]|nr:sodium-coupled neutral amino acid transporter 9-like isoform X3 [Limulus polyphemus]XP_022240067.1 sodium-coupled neutral amino acid transporter 9-like isoform X3 [Limulus polyphemus]XP_022240069.1 sodium-coupled neutral amino acid transporter 9-like isoform X3 [Limulus polyphemus]XP_022240070.1 sodium-coupled neutral amino acid transporter 9-like isoform X3 [Limulus polyphemus]XP_022240071.1 sodium-coupled neutral amino acid transporter 9-like isoform X3 [Limulus polyphemus]